MTNAVFVYSKYILYICIHIRYAYIFEYKLAYKGERHRTTTTIIVESIHARQPISRYGYTCSSYIHLYSYIYADSISIKWVNTNY